jgi:hypothetical protein
MILPKVSQNILRHDMYIFNLKATSISFNKNPNIIWEEFVFHFVATFIYNLNVNKLESIPSNYTLHNDNHGWLLVNATIYKSLF